MNRKKDALLVAAGLLVGTVLAGPAAHAAVEALTATASTQTIYLDGERIDLEAYNIGGRNYVKLRDIGEAVGFNVYWQDGVHIESYAPYTGEPTTDAEHLPVDAESHRPYVGEVIRCTDGTDYTVTDVSRWDANAFAPGPLGDLPEATYDWDQLYQPDLPEAEARHFTVEEQEYMFQRNLHETKRMLYTLYNAMGEIPELWNGENAVTRADGTPKVHIQLTMPEDMSGCPFWPWRESQVVDLINSCPAGTVYMEAWDVYKDGVYQRTEYSIRIK